VLTSLEKDEQMKLVSTVRKDSEQLFRKTKIEIINGETKESFEDLINNNLVLRTIFESRTLSKKITKIKKGVKSNS